jgi:hypothetical protein
MSKINIDKRDYKINKIFKTKEGNWQIDVEGNKGYRINYFPDTYPKGIELQINKRLFIFEDIDKALIDFNTL